MRPKPSSGQSHVTLRDQVMRGGMYLVLRKGATIVVSLVGIVLLTRLIGATNYGLYAATAAILMYVTTFGRLGVDVFLIRRDKPPSGDIYAQTFTISILAGCALAVAVGGSLPLFAHWFGDQRFIWPLAVLVFGLPITLLSLTPIAVLERALDYGAIALLDVMSLTLFYAVAVAAAAAGAGVWAPVSGWLVSQLALLVAACVVTRLRPRFSVSRELLREMFGHGVGYSASSLVWGLRGLANPLIVGRYFGPRGVAYVALAIKFVETLTFVKSATYRLSIAALARVQRDLPRMRRVIEEAMVLQILSVAPFLIVFAAFAPAIVPRAFGEQWQASLDVFPLIALGYTMNSLFNMHSSALYALGRNVQVTLFHGVHVALFFGGALFFVPRFGIIGYGLGEALALAGYLVLHRQLGRVFDVSYRQVVPWAIALVPPLFLLYVPGIWSLLLFLPLVAVLVRRSERDVVARYVRAFRGTIPFGKATRDGASA